MAFGTGWELVESEQYSASYDKHVAGDEWLEDMVEGLYWALLIDPINSSFSRDLPETGARNLLGTFWYAVLPGPPQLLVFYEVREVDRQILLDFVTPDPSLDPR